MSRLMSRLIQEKGQKTATLRGQANFFSHKVGEATGDTTMEETAKKVLSVRRAAAKAWHAVERKHRQALETALKTKRELKELERIIHGNPAA